MFKRPEGKIELSDPEKSLLRLDAIEFAKDTRERLGIHPTDPFDIIKLVEGDGIFVFQIKNLGCSGFVRVFGDKKAIFVNATESLGRQHYTIAHEYCHILRDLKVIKTIKELPDDQKDYRLNVIEYFAFKFADYFLMPDVAIYKALEYLGIADYENLSVTDVIRIQHHFKVSYTQTVRMLNKVLVITDAQREDLKKVSTKKDPERLKVLTLEAGFDTTLVTGLDNSRIPPHFMQSVIDNIRNRRMTSKKVKHLESLLGISLEEYFPLKGSEADE